MDDQKPHEEDFMDFKDPFFDELDKIKQAATDEVSRQQGESSSPAPVEQVSVKNESSSELQILLERIARDASRALSLLTNKKEAQTLSPAALSEIAPNISQPAAIVGTVIEGVFDGTGMVGSDGKQYSMPANYASKSKLVEGDSLKLTITPESTFIYKQTHPVERNRVMGVLSYDATSRQYSVNADGSSWKILAASVTYYKGVSGDEVVILVPKDGTSSWGAVEHIIKKF